MSISIKNDNVCKEIHDNASKVGINNTFKANPTNSLEHTPTADTYEKKNIKKTIGIIATLVGTTAIILGGICWHKGKPAGNESKTFFERLKDGWKELRGKGKKAGESGNSSGNTGSGTGRTSSTHEPNTENITTVEEAEAYLKNEELKAQKKIAESDARNEQWLEKQRMLKEEECTQEYAQLFKQKDSDVKNIQKQLKLYTEIDDKEVAELMYYDLAKKNITLQYDTVIRQPERWFYPIRVITDKVHTLESPLEKERLLKKAAEILEKNDKPLGFASEGVASNYCNIAKELQKIYTDTSVEFKHKGLDKDLLQKATDTLKKHSYNYQRSTKDIPFEVDCELYQKLVEESKEYTDFFHEKTNPMFWGDKGKIKLFLEDIFPKLIKEENDLVTKESLYEKYLTLLLDKLVGKKYTEQYFTTLLEMNSTLYKGSKETADKLGLKKYDFVQEEINKVMDKYIFKKFDLKSVESYDEKLSLAQQVINKRNVRLFYFNPDEVTHIHIANGLRDLSYQTGSEKYFKEALSVLEKNNDIKEANNFINVYLKSFSGKNPEFEAFLSKKQTEYKNLIEQSVNSIIKKFEKTSLKESFDKMMSSNQEFRDAVSEIAKSEGISTEQIHEKMMSGDYKTITRVIKDAVHKSDSEGYWFKDFKPSPIWDDIINYLGNIEEVVKDPIELEKLKNYRIRAIGAKVLEFKKTDPDLANGYMTLLKKEITNVLYGSPEKALTKEAVNQDAVNELAYRIGDLIYVPKPEQIIYNSIEDCMSKASRVRGEEWSKLRTNVKERLKIEDWSESDFYDYFKKHFKGNTKVKQDKGSAIDTFNKYIEGKKLTQDSSAAEIKAAYRKLALKYHPDKCIQSKEDPQLYTKIFQEIGNAYEALTKA